MSKTRLLALLALAFAVPVLSVGTAHAKPQPPILRNPKVVASLHHGTLPSLRDLTPNPQPKGTGNLPDKDKDNGPAVKGPSTDPVRQAVALSPSTPSGLESFEGIGKGFTGPNGTFSDYYGVPDPNLAAGTTQVVQQVNSSIAVFSKSGTVVAGPIPTDSLWAGGRTGDICGSPVSSSINHGDGVVLFDKAAGRWLVTQFAASDSTKTYLECFAVSQTSDATGAWNLYSYDLSPSLGDYPKLGVWPDAYYVTYKYTNGPMVCAMNRAAMLNNAATASAQCFSPGSSDHVIMPADLDGSNPPPSGEPETLLSLNNATNNTVNAWQMHTDWTTPANSTFSGPTPITVAAYNSSCSGACVPQPGTTQTLSTISDTLLLRLAYRNIGGHESLVATHAVATGSTTLGMRWYEFRLGSGGVPAVYQQSTWSPDSTSRWMGGIAMDRVGDIGLGYSTSSSTLSPSIQFTGRLATDPLNQMTQGEGTIQSGSGSQTGLDRWGDYSSLSVDPADDCTFWYTNEYLTSNGSWNWQTRIGSYVLPGCEIRNPSFETGDLSYWATLSGVASVVTPGLDGHAAMLGATTMTNADSTIYTPFYAPYGVHTLSFWYQVHCPDSVQYDWATATLVDAANNTTTVLPHTCTNDGSWSQASVTLTPGQWYGLHLTSHDDNGPSDPTYTLFDEITLS